MRAMSSWRSQLTEARVKEVTQAYLDSSKIPFVSSAHLYRSGDGMVHIQSSWAQPSITLEKKRTFSRLYGLSENLDRVLFRSNPVTTESPENIVTYMNNKQYLISKRKRDKGDDITILEIWGDAGVEKTFNLSEMDIHGQVYTDDEFGSLIVNKAGTRLAYVAEQKRKKPVSFFKANGDFSRDVGSEYSYIETWGEQLEEKSQTVIVTLNLVTEKFEIFDSDILPSDGSPGQIVWISEDTLVGTLTSSLPRRLGVVYCSNRPSSLFKLFVGKLSDEVSQRFVEIVSDPSVNCKYPTVSPDEQQLVWLQRDLSGKFPGPHQSSFKLMALHLTDAQAKPKTVVPIVNHFEPGVDDFAGIFLTPSKIPKRCFLTQDQIVFSTPVFDASYPVIYNLNTGELKVLKDQPHIDVIDVLEGAVLGVRSTPLSSPSLVIGTYSSGDNSISFRPIDSAPPASNENVHHSFTLEPKQGHPDPTFDNVKFNSIYIGPKSDEKGSVPLILWPHGGPHAVTAATFYREIKFFNSLGFGVLLINYRGSLGAGESSVLSLLGHVGDTDVKDCHQAMQECLQKFPFLNRDQVVLFGGSHGGFLVTHLAGQYPDTFKAVVARNPVTNIASMSAITDIPDWTCNECGLAYAYQTPNPDDMKAMYEKSPVAHAHNIKAPIFLMVGKNDLRVPPSQSYQFFNMLKSQNKTVDMNVYEDNHPLAKVPVAGNVMINAALFFQSLLKEF